MGFQQDWERDNPRPDGDAEWEAWNARRNAAAAQAGAPKTLGLPQNTNPQAPNYVGAPPAPPPPPPQYPTEVRELPSGATPSPSAPAQPGAPSVTPPPTGGNGYDAQGRWTGPDLGGEGPQHGETAQQAPGRIAWENSPEAQAENKAAAEAKAAEAEAGRAYLAHFQYGGYAGGANEASQRYQRAGEYGQTRIGEVIDQSKPEWQRQQAQVARTGAIGMADLMATRARGLTPSIAQMQADRQMGQAAAEQSSAAASARGPAGLALAQQGAAANTAAMQSNISNQAQINAAQERLQAEQAGYGAYAGIRQGDTQAQGVDAQMAQAQAQLNAAQRAQNDQYQLGMTGHEVGVQTAQLGAQGNQIASERGQAMQGLALAQQAKQHDEDRSDGLRNGLIGAGAAVTAGAATVAATKLIPGLGGSTAPATPGAGGVTPDNTGTTTGARPQGQGGSDLDGRPVASGGGGYDPDAVSDERAKNIGTWGGAQRGGGSGPSEINMSRLMAHRALDEHSAREGERARGDDARRDGGQASARAGEMLANVKAEGSGRLASGPAVGGPASMTAQQIAAREKYKEDGAMYGAATDKIFSAIDRALSHRQSSQPVPMYSGQPMYSDMSSKDETPLPLPLPERPEDRNANGNALASAHEARLASAHEARANAMLANVNTEGAGRLAGGPAVGAGGAALPPMTPQQQALLARGNSMIGINSALGAAQLGRGPMFSDARAKDEAYALGRAHGWEQQKTGKPVEWAHDMPADIVDKDERKAGEGTAMSGDRGYAKPAGGRAAGVTFARKDAAPQRAAVAAREQQGEAGRENIARGLVAGVANPAVGAGLVLGGSNAAYQANQGQQPPLSDERAKTPMANANRALAAQPYTYKPEFAARSGQAPGEPNVGPMAQTMAADPVAGTAVKHDDPSGMLTLDRDKLQKVTAGGVAELQRQNDAQDRKISFMARRLGGARR